MIFKPKIAWADLRIVQKYGFLLAIALNHPGL